MQKIRKALEKVAKDLKCRDMDDLKVTKHLILWTCTVKHTVEAEDPKCEFMCLSGWFSGGVPRSGEESDIGVYSSEQR